MTSFVFHVIYLLPLFAHCRPPSQVMEEIIAKSKAYKAMKQKQKEDDLEEMDKLDKDYRDLLSTKALASYVKPKGYTK